MLDVIDLFSGAGGSSEGARQAGARVLWAANHWPLAVEVHARNHPETEHTCQDLHQCDWTRVPKCDLVLASPSCRTHSEASQPRRMSKDYDSDRNTPLAVVACLEVVRPRACVVENVVKLRKWELYPEWCSMLRKLGYTLAEHVVDASRLGVPQERERLFITAVRDPAPLLLRLPDLAPVPAGSIREDVARGWAPIEDSLGAKSVARIKLSAARHGDEFVAHYVSDDRGHSLDRPLKTITTKCQWAWIRRRRHGLERRMFTGREYARAMGFDDGYQLTGEVSNDCRLVGNAVCPPVMRAIVTSVAESLGAQRRAA